MKSSLIHVAMAALAAVVGGSLAACGSAPITSYYTLTPPAANGNTAAAPSTSPPLRLPPAYVIEVLPVGVPESLDQPQIVIRKSDSGVAVLENERWSAPLSEELRAALSTQLSRQLGTQDVAGLGAQPGRELLRIKVQMRRFDAWPGVRVNLAADWSIAQAGDTPARLSCRTELTEPALGGYTEMVVSQQRLLSQLSQAIGAAMARWPQGQCPGPLPATAGAAAAAGAGLRTS
ncbi:hypothetical protein SAMN05216359_106268 [Roseateles sp. YR242]|uniref:PqiC family protein n=1 Tax=Roseateles sp. YR242 TaxID=1855305 RepID=UPI0008C76361|nr:PqiC family protein [Roseateles sp. YR242]SEL23503.1 hypothetical protein SAMN05216359_106268 [Roseateles sp. YR242]